MRGEWTNNIPKESGGGEDRVRELLLNMLSGLGSVRLHLKGLSCAQKVREAEISEFNSHVVNRTFGPVLSEHDFAAGPPLKAVWVYSKSKKDPDSFKARVVIGRGS